MAFTDRVEAGRELAERLVQFREHYPIVLGLARGGVEVAAEVATALGADLGVLVVRKIGMPANPEYGLGAVTEEGYYWLDVDRAAAVDVAELALERVLRREVQEVRRRTRLYRGSEEPVPVASRTVILVDDGLATGVTARVAVRYLRQRGVRYVIVAVPVASTAAADELRQEADRLVCVHEVEQFTAVGLWYADFQPVEDDDVVRILMSARSGRATALGA